MKREDEIHALIPDERAQAVERSAVEVVPVRVSSGHVVLTSASPAPFTTSNARGTRGLTTCTGTEYRFSSNDDRSAGCRSISRSNASVNSFSRHGIATRYRKTSLYIVASARSKLWKSIPSCNAVAGNASSAWCSDARSISGSNANASVTLTESGAGRESTGPVRRQWVGRTVPRYPKRCHASRPRYARRGQESNLRQWRRNCHARQRSPT